MARSVEMTDDEAKYIGAYLKQKSIERRVSLTWISDACSTTLRPGVNKSVSTKSWFKMAEKKFIMANKT